MQDKTPNKLSAESVKEPLEIITGKLTNWYELIMANLPNLLLSILIFVLAIWLSRLVRRFIRTKLNHRIEKASLRSLVASAASFLIIGVGIMLALSSMNLDTALKSILAGAGVAGLAIGLALQGVLSNVFAGIILSIADIVNVGDWVETADYKGKVDHITLRNTFLIQKDNTMAVIPNSTVINNPFVNVGLTETNKIIIACGVHYDSDLRAVKKILERIVADHFPPPSPELKPQILWHTFNDSSIDFEFRFWFDSTERAARLEAKSEAIMLIHEYFNEAGIEIPFPIRTLVQEKPIAIDLGGDEE